MKKIARLILILLSLLLVGCSKADNTESSIALGMKSLENSSYEDAVTNFKDALNKKEDSVEAYRGLGIAYMGLNDYTKAIDAFEKALKKVNGKVNAKVYDISYYMAAAQMKNNNAAEAIRIYTNMIDYKDKEGFTSYLRGIAYLSTKQIELAKADFTTAISKDKKDYNLYIEIFENMNAYGYKDEGMLYLKQAQNSLKKEDKETVEYCYNAGRIYYYQDNYEEARTLLEKAQEAGNKDAVLYLGKTYEALGDLNYAATLYTSYLTTDNTSAQIYNQLGLCQMKLGAYDKALEAIESGISLGDKNFMKNLKFNEIVAYEYLNDYDKAKLLMQDYLTLYPDDAEAVRENQFLKTR